MNSQIVIVGAGPAGLAAAIQLSGRGLAVTLLEKASAPPDKACGEGLMPSGVVQLSALGVRERLGPHDCHQLKGVRYIQEDGSCATGHLPSPGGLGIRRTTLTAALTAAAIEAGVEIVWNCSVEDHHCGTESVQLTTTLGPVQAELLVAADGLHSPVRRRQGLSASPERPRRFGLRRHYRVAPWSEFVEIHLAPGREAFVTPVAPDLVGVAILWDRELWTPDPGPEPTYPKLLAGFPGLAARLAGSEVATDPRGAGPLAQRVRATVAQRLVLVGDAAGYRDAITGEGLSLAFASAAALAAITPRALEKGADSAALRPYAHAHARLYRRYALVADITLAIARRPRLRRPLVRWLGARPGRLDRLVGWGLG
jgi:2-polyprenyl-6-methoxyphenol hydroxylase-like FAD-dependent oxidoreductase